MVIIRDAEDYPVRTCLSCSFFIYSNVGLQIHVRDNGSVWHTSFELPCPTSASQQGLLPVFLAQMPSEGGNGGQYLVIAQGLFAEAPPGVTLPEADVFPLLGPMGGGTEIMLQVHKSWFAICQALQPSILHRQFTLGLLATAFALQTLSKTKCLPLWCNCLAMPILSSTHDNRLHSYTQPCFLHLCLQSDTLQEADLSETIGHYHGL